VPPRGISIDVPGIAGSSAEGNPVEIKEWQAIMEHRWSLPATRLLSRPALSESPSTSGQVHRSELSQLIFPLSLPFFRGFRTL